MTLKAIKYDGSNLHILDQLQLPYVMKYVQIRTAQEGWHAIRQMRVRGAPAIAIVAILSLAVELRTLLREEKLSPIADEVCIFIIEKLQYLVTSRQTAVNLSDAARKFEHLITSHANTAGATGHRLVATFFKEAERMLANDLNDNQNIGANGAKWIVERALLPGRETVNVLTHCNTGSLATSGYGTALGIIRSLHSSRSLNHAYCTETRPYNQGSRLTAFELVHDSIPSTLITDSMTGALLASEKGKISAVIVGADRVAANGDTANKIGTYGLAVLARHHGAKFVIAAPRTTIDRETKSGNEIIIEERPGSEVTEIKGFVEEDTTGFIKMESIHIAAPGIDVWNPAFDITPAALIDAIVTEVGVMEKGPDGYFCFDALFDSLQTS